MPYIEFDNKHEFKFWLDTHHVARYFIKFLNEARSERVGHYPGYEDHTTVSIYWASEPRSRNTIELAYKDTSDDNGNNSAHITIITSDNIDIENSIDYRHDGEDFTDIEMEILDSLLRKYLKNCARYYL